MNQPTFSFSGDAKADDILACLDSYAVEVRYADRVISRGPISWLEYRQPPVGKVDLTPKIDPKLELLLLRYDPPAFDTRIPMIRWPFYVSAPLQIGFLIGDQWWIYKFSPGRLYEERSIESAEK